MTSTEKVWALVERLQQSSDEEITAAVPLGVPPAMLRGGLLMFTDQLPQQPAELDQFLDQMGEFLLSLRSDNDAALAH